MRLLSVPFLISCTPPADKVDGVDDNVESATVCDGDDATGVVVLVAPYLQSVTTTSAYVMWETDVGVGSRVDYGDSSALGDMVCGNQVPTLEGTDPNGDETQVHAAQLMGLSPATTYHYRVRTGDAESEVVAFTTPAESAAEATIRFVAMSDSQRDDNNPGQFAEVIQQGVLRTTDELSLVLFPGDLVDNGWIREEWQDEFFAPAADLFASVPVYPALGNHEGGSPFYYRYFQLPEDGLKEHAYHVDIGNLRIVTLDSNGWQAQEQLAWLDEQLVQACDDMELDFVFAQLHHPWLSELWTPGNTDFTGEVVERMVAFTADCGKPTIHFFGHTHGYSRGQDQDHEHVMVNVASAGGKLDRWGEHPQADYAEFSVSQDTWGFVAVDVEAGDNPSFTLRRISRGNADVPSDNEETDQLTVYRFNQAPHAPTDLSSTCDNGLLFSASAFADGDGQNHQATQWQVAATCSDFASPTLDRWRQQRNEFNGVDLQADDDLTNETVGELAPFDSVCWRVRYRDDGLAWSDWSVGQTLVVPDCG
jgi:acid phosphatase type 7